MDDATGNATDVTGYTMTVEEVAARFQEAGVPRAIRTIQRYCNNDYLRCQSYSTETGMRYFIDPQSVDRRILEIQQIQQAQGDVISRQGAPGHDMSQVEAEPDFDGSRHASYGDTPRPQTSDAGRCSMAGQQRSDVPGADDNRQGTPGHDTSKVSSLDAQIVTALVRELDTKNKQIEDLAEQRNTERQFLTHVIEQQGLQIKGLLGQLALAPPSDDTTEPAPSESQAGQNNEPGEPSAPKSTDAGQRAGQGMI